jgi:hypothetical protein
VWDSDAVGRAQDLDRLTREREIVHGGTGTEQTPDVDPTAAIAHRIKPRRCTEP